MMQLIHGDCLEEMKDIPNNSVDLTVTSPPYDNLRNYNNSLSWDLDIFKIVAAELFRITKQGGVIVWIVSDATHNGSETGTSFKQALYFKEIGFNLHDTMIWNKPTFTSVGACKVRYGQVFEYMFIFSKGKPNTFNPIKDRPVKRVGLKKHGTIRQRDGSLKKQSSIGKVYNNTHAQRFNVWNMSGVVSNSERTGHPAMFPLNLATDHVISWSNENDIVLDMFMGSGSTGIACLNTNRSFIGIEKDEKFFQIAKDRIESHTVKMEILK